MGVFCHHHWVFPIRAPSPQLSGQITYSPHHGKYTIMGDYFHGGGGGGYNGKDPHHLLINDKPCINAPSAEPVHVKF